MPRAIGKKKLGFWFSEEERELLKDLAYAEGLTQTDLIRSLMVERARKLALEPREKPAHNDLPKVGKKRKENNK